MTLSPQAFKQQAREAVVDPQLRRALDHVKSGFINKRAKARARLPEFEALRDAARDIKNHTLAHLDLYEKTWGERKFYGRLKKFYKMYVSAFPGASHLRTEMMETNSISEARNMIRAWRKRRVSA